MNWTSRSKSGCETEASARQTGHLPGFTGCPPPRFVQMLLPSVRALHFDHAPCAVPERVEHDRTAALQPPTRLLPAIAPTPQRLVAPAPLPIAPSPPCVPASD